MTRDEVKKIIGIISCSYPNFKPAVDMGFMVDTWTALLSDMEYKDVSKNLTRYIQSDTSGFAPSIGELRAMSVTEYPSELEAWAIVRRSISNSLYDSNEEFAKLPDILKRAVGSPDNLYHWARMDSETLGSVEQSHFINVYRSVVLQAKNNEAVRSDLKQHIEIPQAYNKEEPLMIETEKPTANQEKIQELINKLKERI